MIDIESIRERTKKGEDREKAERALRTERTIKSIIDSIEYSADNGRKQILLSQEDGTNHEDIVNFFKEKKFTVDQFGHIRDKQCIISWE